MSTLPASRHDWQLSPLAPRPFSQMARNVRLYGNTLQGLHLFLASVPWYRSIRRRISKYHRKEARALRLMLNELYAK